MAWSKNVDGLRWLHISDFHISSRESYDRDVVLRALISSVSDLVTRYGKPDIVFATGDVAFSGKEDEYKLATGFFDNLLSALGLERSALFVVPGNHDVDRDQGKGLKRTIDSREESDDYFSSAEQPIHILRRQKAFAAWYDSFFTGIRSFPFETSCFPVESISIRGTTVAILPINTAIFSYDDHDQGRLFIGRACIDHRVRALSQEKKDVTIALMHHPLAWLSSVESTNIKTCLRDNVDIILHGHLHENEVEHVASRDGDTLTLSAGATYQTRKWPNCILFCSYSDRVVSVAPVIYSDSPREAWVPDASLFTDAPDFVGSFELRSAGPEENIASTSPSPSPQPAPAGTSLDADPSSVDPGAHTPWEQDLFLTAGERVLYAEPRLMDRAPEMAIDDENQTSSISVLDLVERDGSFLIETRPEYGGSTLCRRLEYEFSAAGKTAFHRDARDLPNYRNKLERHFPPEAKAIGAEATLILDHFDADRDERLLRELQSTGWFKRAIIVTVNRSILATRPMDLSSLPFQPSLIYLWPIARSDIRVLASALFATPDEVYLSKIVGKVYSDLLDLCIPLTPANVVMYLRILYREGDFQPLSRVDIVGRYIFETLRRPGDVYGEALSAKSRSDLVSAFVYDLYSKGSSSFDDRAWMEFCERYQKEVLCDFDSRALLNELLEGRILARFGQEIYLRYSFFFSYFLGRQIALRSELVAKFLDDEEYLRLPGVVDVVTGLSSDNVAIIERLTAKMNDHLASFAGKYVADDFDPLLKALWPDSEREDEDLWEPVQAAIEAGPRSTKEIDKLKTSMLAEARTADQEVRLEKFAELEHALFAVDVILGDALKNAEDIPGPLKLSALDSLLRASLVAFQVGAVFAPALARRKRFNWGGVQYIDFHKVGEEVDPGSHEAFALVIDALCRSIASKEASEMGSYRLAAVFRERAKQVTEVRFVDVLLFHCILAAKGRGWAETLSVMIEKAGRHSYYLCAMLDALMYDLDREITRVKDREAVKRLVAIIQAKRTYSKQAPGAKLVNKMLEHLEDIDHFAKNKDDGA